MSDKEHVDKLEEGVDAWNDWRRDNPRDVPDFSGVDFGKGNVAGVNFRGANLRDARLGNVTGLLPANLAGADLTGAILPTELSAFPALEHVAEVSRHARVNFLAVVAGCVFCWLTIAQTTDGDLLADRGALPLPVINTRVPVSGFFLFAPAILLALYVYLQLYLQRMWDGLSHLPAVFPDGSRLDQRAFPWLLSGLVNLYIHWLSKEVPPFAWLQVFLSVVAAWLLVPLTIGWFWLRYLLATNEIGIAPHVVLLALAVGLGALFYRRAHATLRGLELPGRFARRFPAPGITAPLLVLVASLGATVFVTYELRLNTDHWHLEFTGEAVTGSAKLETAELKELNIESIKKLTPLVLKHVSFRHAEGREAILFRVDLTNVDLSFSSFEAADLRMANLQNANLTQARFDGANLEDAKLFNARLDGADLAGAIKLTKDALFGACGVGTKLPKYLPQGYALKPCPSSDAQVASAGRAASDSEISDKSETKSRELEVAVGLPPDPRADKVHTCEDKDTTRNFICPQMVEIPAGKFVMGSPEDENGRYSDEGPQHGVTIAAPFAVGKYEVTRGEFAKFVDEANYEAGNSCYTFENDKLELRPGRNWRKPGFDQSDRDPVVCVSWEDAKAYVTWLSTRTKKKYHLLTEAEWEYVARAGTTTPFHTGNRITTEQANFDGNYTYNGSSKGEYRRRTVNVGSFPANRFGVHDMHGNVWEWVEDCWHGDYSGAPTDGSAWKDKSDCSDRVLRGGSWYFEPGLLRSANRVGSYATDRSFTLGFRVSRTLSR